MNHWACLKASCKVISLARKVPISWLPIYIQWLVQGFNRREKINAPSPTHLSTIGSIYINLSICPCIDQYSHFICVCSYSFPNLIVLRFECLNYPCLKLLMIVNSNTKFPREKRNLGCLEKLISPSTLKYFTSKAHLWKRETSGRVSSWTWGKIWKGGITVMCWCELKEKTWFRAIYHIVIWILI